MIRLLLTLTLITHLLSAHQVKATTPYKQILSDPTQYTPVRLVYNSLHDYLLVPVKINGGKTQYFLLDTGMTSTSLTLKAVQSMGLELIDSNKSSSGVAGVAKSYTVKLDSLVIGAASRYSDLQLSVSNIPALDKASNYGGVPLAGLIGSDLLANLNAVIDYGSGTLFIPKTKSDTGLSKALIEAEFVKAPFVDFKEYRIPVLNSQVAGEECLLIYDTGAKASLLTEAFVETNTKIRVFKTTTKVSGIAGDAASRQAYVTSIKFAGVNATKNGVIVADLSHMAKKGRKNWSGIIGSDLMFPSRSLIDYGSKAIYSTTLELDAAEYGKAGLFPGSKEEIKARMTKCEAIATGKLTQLVFDKGAPLKDANGNSYLKATVTFLPSKTYKGKLVEGEKIQVKVIVPNTKSARQDLIDQAVSQPRRIMLTPSGANGRRVLFSQTFLRTSAVRDAHLLKVLK